MILRQMLQKMMMSGSSIQSNWILKLALNGGWLDDKEDNNSNVNVIEKADLSSTIETDNEDDDQQNSSNIFIKYHVFNNNLLIIIKNLIVRRDDLKQMTQQPREMTPDR